MLHKLHTYFCNFTDDMVILTFMSALFIDSVISCSDLPLTLPSPSELLTSALLDTFDATGVDPLALSVRPRLSNVRSDLLYSYNGETSSTATTVRLQWNRSTNMPRLNARYSCQNLKLHHHAP